MAESVRVAGGLVAMLVGIALLIAGTTELELNAQVVIGGLLMVLSVGWMAYNVGRE